MIRKFDETEQYDTSMKIIFATNNAHKLSEVQAVLGPDFELVTPRSVGITEEIPEQQDTIAGNASQKARYVHDRTGCDCFADDTVAISLHPTAHLKTSEDMDYHYFPYVK